MKKIFTVFSIFILATISIARAGATCVTPSGSGGYDRSFEKLDVVGNLSYNYLIPLGKWGKCGNFRNAGYMRPGHGADLELLQYFIPGEDEDFRLAFGFSDQLFFFPMCTKDINTQLDHAFAADTLAHTNYDTPNFNCFKAIGVSAQANVLYTWDQFSLEGTLKAGPMIYMSPGYTTVGGNYVPAQYSYLFQEQLNKKNTWSYYFHLGVNANFFFTDHIGIFAGGGFSYTRPTFKNEVMNVHIENGNTVIEREKTSHSINMPFLQIRAGVTFHIGKWD